MPNDEADHSTGKTDIGVDDGSKKRVLSIGEDEGLQRSRAPKRLRVSEPDVVVKVGDQKYEHYSVLLCAASPYFDTMLSIEMKERLSGTIEFANKDPQEWEALMPFLEPHAPALSLASIQQLLPWFHELQMDALLEQADQFLKKKVQETRDAKIKGDVHEFISILELSDKFALEGSREAALDYLEDCIRKGHIILGSGGVSRLVPFLRVRSTLWDVTKKHLPEEFRNGNKEDLLNNPLFAFVVSARWRLRSKKKEGRRSTATTSRIAGRRASGGIAPIDIREIHLRERESMVNVQEAVAAAVEHIQREFDHVEQRMA